MAMSSKVEIPSVLQHKLGEDGAAALTEMMQAFWQEHFRDLEDRAWRGTAERLDRVEAAIERLTEAQTRTEAKVEQLRVQRPPSRERGGGRDRTFAGRRLSTIDIDYP